MLRISLILTIASLSFFAAALFIWGARLLETVNIRAPTKESAILQYLKKLYSTRKHGMLLTEVSTIELFVSRMLNSGVYTVHEIIGVCAETSIRLKSHFTRCYNRYFAHGSAAIEQMRDEIGDESFNMLCDALIFASAFNKQDMGKQVNEHLEHLKKLRAYKRQQVISHKETKFAFAMILPIVAFLIVQVYPWLMQAMEQLNIIW